MSKDEVKDRQGFYNQKKAPVDAEHEEGATEIAGRPSTLPSIPTPPSGAIKLAFATAIRYRSIEGAINAYDRALRALIRSQESLDRLDAMKVDTDRVTRLLEDAEEIHRTDAANRRATRIHAEDAEAEAEHQAVLNKIRRTEELAEARGVKTSSKRSQDEEEYLETLKHAFKPGQYQKLSEEVIEELGLNEEDAARAREIASKIAEDTLS